MATSRPTPTSEYSTYPLDKLRTLWGRAELTPEQMMGHLLQHQIDQEARLLWLERLVMASHNSQSEAIAHK